MTKVLELQLQHQSFQQVFRDEFPYNWLVWSPCCPRDFQESSPPLQFEGINSLVFSFMVQLSQPYMTTGNTIALTIWSFVSRVMSLLFNILSRFVIVFLPRSNHLLISWLQSLSAVILEPKKSKFVTASTFSPSICHEVMGLDAMVLVFLTFSFKLAFSLFSFTLIKRCFSSSSLSSVRVYHPHIWGCWCLSHLSWYKLVTHPAWHSSWCAQHIG